jgi:hypothetical protein
MKTFVELTQTNGRPVWVAADAIVKVTEQEQGGAALELVRTALSVQEVPAVVRQRIRDLSARR